MVFRVHKTANYTVMSNYHLQDKSLSLKAKGLLSMMLSLPSDWDYSARGLAELSKDGEDAVKSGLRELEEHNYLKREQIRVKGIITDWQYDIYETPLGENPLVENESQLNTKEENTKENSNSTNVELGQAPAKHRHLIPDSKPAKKKSRYEQCVDVINDKIQPKDIELKEILTDYLKMRLAIKDKPMYVSGWKALIDKLQSLSPNASEQCRIVRQSLENSWATFYPLKNNNYKRGQQDQRVFSEFGKVKSDIRKDEVIVNVQY